MAGLGAVLLLAQALYFLSVLGSLGKTPAGDFDLVLTYSDVPTMDPALDLALSRDKPLYVSQAPWEGNPFPRRSAADLARVVLDPTGATTDQNARQAAAYIRKGGYQRVLLDVGWFHVPRALFLTRLYLAGSGVKVAACSKSPLPPGWWAQPLLHTEILKFWGSLGRVGLAFFGWETGPPPPRWYRYREN
jgi:hypothetical protein